MDNTTTPPIDDDSNILLTRGEVREFAASLRRFSEHMEPIPFLGRLTSLLREWAVSIDGQPEPEPLACPRSDLEKSRTWHQGWPWMAHPMFCAVASVRGQFLRQRLPDLERVAEKFGVNADDLAACLRSAPKSSNGAWARDFFRLTEEG